MTCRTRSVLNARTIVRGRQGSEAYVADSDPRPNERPELVRRTTTRSEARRRLLEPSRASSSATQSIPLPIFCSTAWRRCTRTRSFSGPQRLSASAGHPEDRGSSRRRHSGGAILFRRSGPCRKAAIFSPANPSPKDTPTSVTGSLTRSSICSLWRAKPGGLRDACNDEQGHSCGRDGTGLRHHELMEEHIRAAVREIGYEQDGSTGRTSTWTFVARAIQPSPSQRRRWQ